MSKYQIKIGFAHIAANALGNKEEINRYQVISVKNTIDHLPGEQLSKKEVDLLCKSSIWDVTLVPLRGNGGDDAL